MVHTEAPDARGGIIRLELSLLGGCRLHEPLGELLLLLRVSGGLACSFVDAEDSVELDLSRCIETLALLWLGCLVQIHLYQARACFLDEPHETTLLKAIKAVLGIFLIQVVEQKPREACAPTKATATFRASVQPLQGSWKHKEQGWHAQHIDETEHFLAQL